MQACDGQLLTAGASAALMTFSCCLLPAACCLLPAACCLLPAACCLLPAACCLLSCQPWLCSLIHQALSQTSQVGFKRELVREVKAFVVDAQQFRRDWEANGPMVPGLDPMDAVDRLKKFQQMFEVGTGSAASFASVLGIRPPLKAATSSVLCAQPVTANP
jgi:hypothetical protein